LVDSLGSFLRFRMFPMALNTICLKTGCVLKLRFERFGMHVLDNIYVLGFLELRFGRLSMTGRS